MQSIFFITFIAVKLALLTLFSSLLPFVCYAQEDSENVAKRLWYIEALPLSKYNLGKNSTITFGVRSRRHSLSAGIAVHINNNGGYSNTNDLTNNNGHAYTWDHYLHLTAGYSRYLAPLRSITPFFYGDLVCGRIGLNNKFYGFDSDSSGNRISIRQFSPEVPPGNATFVQLVLGIGAQIALNDRFAITQKIGCGESYVSYWYEPIGGLRFKETTFDHFVLHYGVGIVYFLKKP